MRTSLPRWNLDNVYPGLESGEFARDLGSLAETLDLIDRLDNETLRGCSPKTPGPELASALDQAVDLFNSAFLLSSTLRIYVESFVSTNSYDTAAAKKLSELEIVQVRVKQAWTRFQVWTKTVAEALPSALASGTGNAGTSGSARAHAFILKETAEQAAWLMSGGEESLAAELSLSGASAWSKLQRMLTSRIVVELDVDGTRQSFPMPALINFRSHPQESVRRRAYEAEITEWQRLKEPLAACMNGVKGSSETLSRRRGREDSLHSAIDQARIDRGTLDALLDAMKGSLPQFHRYFLAKAARLGKKKLAWWDLFAPSGAAESTYTWDQARSLILSNFGGFSPSLRSFAERAFDERWIDAEPRDGKVGGAFCEPVPSVKESRILCNFDGSLEQVSTVAHELGHGFHNDCAFRAGKTMLQQSTPMTLAETASIMCETIINDALLARATEPREQLALLENGLINESQVIVDIYSRFLFEKEVLERRARSELSADELCEIMDRAQAAAYGDALDEHFRHPYMWTWKPHYYFAELDFYNFPYAFGLLFGTGLYAVYRARGASFVTDYEKLLASTGEASAADLAAGFGIDIRARAFWDQSIAVISRKIDQYCAISA
jgi:pepF/M3 family oligoendopeptidase